MLVNGRLLVWNVATVYCGCAAVLAVGLHKLGDGGFRACPPAVSPSLLQIDGPIFEVLILPTDKLRQCTTRARQNPETLERTQELLISVYSGVLPLILELSGYSISSLRYQLQYSAILSGLGDGESHQSGVLRPVPANPADLAHLRGTESRSTKNGQRSCADAGSIGPSALPA